MKKCDVCGKEYEYKIVIKYVNGEKICEHDDDKKIEDIGMIVNLPFTDSMRR